MADVAVVRLVTQFDDVETHGSLATPTCCGGCCCCCCCCLATIIGTSSLTAMHVHRLQKASHDPTIKLWPTLLAVFSLPIALGLAALTQDVGALILAPIVWAALLAWAFWGAGSRIPIRSAIGVAVLGSVVLVVEFFIALAMLEAIGAYLFLSVVVGVGVAVAGYRATK